MDHYICVEGCRAVTDSPGTCNDEVCPGQGHDLQLCDCEDDDHYGAFGDEDELIPIEEDEEEEF